MMLHERRNKHVYKNHITECGKEPEWWVGLEQLSTIYKPRVIRQGCPNGVYCYK